MQINKISQNFNFNNKPQIKKENKKNVSSNLINSDNFDRYTGLVFKGTVISEPYEIKNVQNKTKKNIPEYSKKYLKVYNKLTQLLIEDKKYSKEILDNVLNDKIEGENKKIITDVANFLKKEMEDVEKTIKNDNEMLKRLTDLVLRASKYEESDKKLDDIILFIYFQQSSQYIEDVINILIREDKNFDLKKANILIEFLNPLPVVQPTSVMNEILEKYCGKEDGSFDSNVIKLLKELIEVFPEVRMLEKFLYISVNPKTEKIDLRALSAIKETIATTDFEDFMPDDRNISMNDSVLVFSNKLARYMNILEKKILLSRDKVTGEFLPKLYTTKIIL